MDEENSARGEPQTAFEQALAHQRERATRDQRRESESCERQRYAREWEEQIDFEQSEPYPMPMSEPDPPAEAEPSSRGDTNPKVKISLEEYRDRQGQERSAEAKEEDDNTTPPAGQDQQATAMVGSHTPCYDEQGQELDYHDDVPIADSHGSFTCSDYFCQYHGEEGKLIAEQLDAEHAMLLANTTQPPTVSEEAVPPKEVMPAVDATTAANPEWKGWGYFLRQYGDPTGVPVADRLDVEELLQGPTEPVTVTEEAVLLDEALTIGSEEVPTVISKEPMPTAELQEMPAAVGETPMVDLGQVLAGLQTLTLEMLAEVSTHVDRLRQLATPSAPTKPSPPGLPATPMVPNPMECEVF